MYNSQNGKIIDISDPLDMDLELTLIIVVSKKARGSQVNIGAYRHQVINDELRPAIQAVLFSLVLNF